MKATALLVSIVLSGSVASGQADPAHPPVSPQGILLDEADPGLHVSPLGTRRMLVVPLAGDFQRLESELRISSSDGSLRHIPRVRGNSFFVSELDRIVVVEAYHSNAVPTRLSVLDLEGRELHVRGVRGLGDAQLSNDGRHLAYRAGGGIVVLDLASFTETRHPNLSPFAAGPNGILVGARPGEVVARDARGREISTHIDARLRRVSFDARGSAALLLTARALLRMELPSARLRTLFTAPEDGELRDLHVSSRAIRVGLRQTQGEAVSGTVFELSVAGSLRGSWRGQSIVPPRAPRSSTPLGGIPGIPWPLQPNGQHPVGNTYGEYQFYGGSPYMHPGVDILGADRQPVFAVASGVVKAVLTTSGEWHWRVATGKSGSGTSEGYLYAHIDEPTIAVNVGDTVTEGQYLGDLVPWPVAGFTHCHFARIEDTGLQWFGSWLCTDNPHVDLQFQSDPTAPFFEPAIGSDMFAFCENETSNYLDPTALQGEVDIVVHVADAIGSTWECSVQEIRYSIHPLGNPGSPVVDDKLAVFFDMALDTYQGGPIDPFLVDLLYKQDGVCTTEGDYDDREFFHVITNSDGDQIYEPSDLLEAWDTTLVADGDYVVAVTATDVAGNSLTASMVVTTDNGNP